MTGRFSGHDPARGHDTAGVPWAGRTLAGTGFDGDQGGADTDLLAALADPADERRLVAAVQRARLIVPVVALPGTVGDSAGPAGDVTSDMAAVTLTAPDGTRALPVFTSVAALAGWDPTARPVPVSAQRAAQAAVQERCEVMVLDPAAPGVPMTAGAPGHVVLRGSMVWATAMARAWLPAHEDPEVARAVSAAAREERAVHGHRLAAGAAGALQVTLALQSGLDRQTLQGLVTRIGERLATDGEVRARIDAVAFSVVAAAGGWDGHDVPPS